MLFIHFAAHKLATDIGDAKIFLLPKQEQQQNRKKERKKERYMHFIRILNVVD